MSLHSQPLLRLPVFPESLQNHCARFVSIVGCGVVVSANSSKRNMKVENSSDMRRTETPPLGREEELWRLFAARVNGAVPKMAHCRRL
jgi:hypothetical protein